MTDHEINVKPMADLLRRAEDGSEFEFKGWTLLVLDGEPPDGRQVKVSLDADRPDFGAFWLDIDEHLENELRELAVTEAVYGVGS